MRKKLFLTLSAFSLFNYVLAQITNPTTVSNPNLNQAQNPNLQSEYLKAVSNPALVASYNWWRNVNPTNYEVDPLTDVGKSLRDSGIVNYYKKTKISLVGWTVPGGTGINDDSIIHLKPLTKLEHIIVPGYTSDAGILHLTGFSNLKTLRFARNGMSNDLLTEAGIRTISQMTKLEFLELPPSTRIKAGGYNNLKNLVNLKEIRLIEWSVPATELSFLAYMKNLRKINFYRSRITDTAFAYLTGHPYIEALELEFAPITNKSLAVLAGFRTLKDINIGHSQLDLDTGFNEFRNVLVANPSLKRINMFGVKLSNDNLTRLRNDFPGVSFFR